METKAGYVCATAKKLKGSRVFLGGAYGSTVLGTANVMMAATLAEGTTIIENAACEPEVENLAEALVMMGAEIKGGGTPRLEIHGVKKLTGATVELIPDRIEAGTIMAATAAAGGHVTIKDMRPEHLSAVTDKLQQMGTEVEICENSCTVFGGVKPKATTLVTHPYPGFPTDLQAQFMTILTVGDGTSVVTEKVYPDRFMHISELQRMAADVRKEGSSAIVVGVDRLSGAPVMASDLRASAALVIAGLAAEGQTQVKRVYHIDRGYEGIVEKLKGLGARIERVLDEEHIPAEG
jgi:UDP-N-acetylglucosamine 1-carboxyvinyltransferase